MMSITYAVVTTGTLRLTVQLLYLHQPRGGLNLSKSTAKFRPSLPLFNRTDELGRDKIALIAKQALETICPIWKTSGTALERVHSSKCQPQTLNIQRRAPLWSIKLFSFRM